MEELEVAPQEEIWGLYTDGSSTKTGANAECVIVLLRGEPLTYGLVLSYLTTNNEAE